ncbi:hypothetical protein T265_03033 [Opisthorchis viverrini]|uniref:Uncharacterized protein n=1 Tax=Opisthorchis viverrini TaxID=6198 RepID=A0A075AHV7_OPIVI|nr:hypothetical protein T265_03033 [Opisthorchis viverrini]KER30554.1 hypothetical protein T265_03033 [Opisthorchis viverrini]
MDGETLGETSDQKRMANSATVNISPILSTATSAMEPLASQEEYEDNTTRYENTGRNASLPHF